MRFPRNAKIFRGQFDPAPWAGLFFILIIFWMLRSELLFYPGVAIHLPEGQVSNGVSRPLAVVVMDVDGGIYLDNQLIDTSGLVERLMGLKANWVGDRLVVVLEIDKRIPWGEAARLGDLLSSQVGVEEVLLAFRPRFRTVSEQKVSGEEVGIGGEEP